MRSFLSASDIVTGCWITFFAVWLLAALATKRSVYRESSIQRLRYGLFLIIGYVLLFKGRRLSYPLDLLVIPHTEVTAWSGAVFCVIGLVCCLWARVTLGRNWSGTITLKEGHELIVRGPYRFVRHPIYTGLMTMYLATVVLFGHFGGMIGAVCVFASFWIKLRDEEKLMLEHFPDQYPAYQRRVKRIIPFLL